MAKTQFNLPVYLENTYNILYAQFHSVQLLKVYSLMHHTRLIHWRKNKLINYCEYKFKVRTNLYLFPTSECQNVISQAQGVSKIV
jgi:hypothetical protein